MKKSNFSKQSLCGDRQCTGSSCGTCQAIRASVDEQSRIECPNGVPSCKDGRLCDKCATDKYPKHEQPQPRRGAVGGGKKMDMVPRQDFLNEELCFDCGKTVGSNSQKCGICASILESPLNPAQPPIHYDPNFGPAEGSFGPCTDETTKKTMENFRGSFEASKKNGFPFTGINNFNRSASLLRNLISQGTTIGFEGFNNSCFYVVLIWMLSQGNMHGRINTNCLSGHILYKILWDLRARLFVGRNVVEAFRLSLQEYDLVQRSKSNFEQGMDDFGYLLGLLEDDEVGILHKGPNFSHTGCSFLVHESMEFKHGSIQEALCASVSSPSPVPEDGSIISFQFSQQKSDHFTRQTLGTEFEFPHNGVVLAGKFLRPKMFIIYHSQHYLVVLCVGEAFFRSNSLSASQCGHFLPETHEISETDAMKLFRTQAHTIVFECVGNFLPPPIQPPPSAQGPWVPSPPPLPAPSAQQAPQKSPKKVVVWFIDNYYSYDPENKVLRSITGRIIDGIKAGFYDVQEKGTRGKIRIELREVLSDDALPPPAPRAQVFSQIQLADITIRDGEWSIRSGSFFQSGTCVVSLNQYTLDRVQYDQTQFLTVLNILYKKSCE